MSGNSASRTQYWKEKNCHETQTSAPANRGILQTSDRFTAKGPTGPLRRFRRPMMTKTTVKTNAAAKQPAPSTPLIVLGYDEAQKPRGAKFLAADRSLVTKAA